MRTPPISRNLNRSQARILLVSLALIGFSFVAGFYYAQKNEFYLLFYALASGGLIYVSTLGVLLIKKRFLYFFLLLLPALLYSLCPPMVTGRMSQQEQELALMKKNLERRMIDSDEGIVYALKELPKNHLISNDDIGIKQIERSGFTKLLTARKYEVVGLRTKRRIETGLILTKDDVATPNQSSATIEN